MLNAKKQPIKIDERMDFRSNALAINKLDDPNTYDASHNDPVLVRRAILASRIEQLKNEHPNLRDNPALYQAGKLLELPTVRWIELREAERLVYSTYDEDETIMALKRLYAERHILGDDQQDYYEKQMALLALPKDEARERIIAKTLEQLSDCDDIGNRGQVKATSQILTEIDKTEARETSRHIRSKSRILLRQLSEDLHTANGIAFRKRWSIVKLQQHKLTIFGISFLSFLAISLVFVLAAVKMSNPILLDGFPNWIYAVRAFSDPAVAVFAGAFGAAFSMLQSRTSALEALTQEALDKAMKFQTLLLRISVGVGGSLILYYFLLSNIIDQSLLPPEALVSSFVVTSDGGGLVGKLTTLFPWLHWENVASDELISSFTNHAKLTVFCFVAGFSERLVPGVVQQLSGTMKIVDSPKA